MISRRLKKIAEMVDEGADVVDVGCDHAFLDIYLHRNKNCHCLAIDNKNIEKAITNIKRFYLENKITVLKNEGLENVDIKNKTIVISGMGRRSIIKIISNIYCESNILILQANNGIIELKEYLNKNKFNLLKEENITDKGKNYTILKYSK